DQSSSCRLRLPVFTRCILHNKETHSKQADSRRILEPAKLAVSLLIPHDRSPRSTGCRRTHGRCASFTSSTGRMRTQRRQDGYHWLGRIQRIKCGRQRATGSIEPNRKEETAGLIVTVRLIT